MVSRGTGLAGLACALVAALPLGAQEDGPARETRAEPARALDDGALRAVFLDLVGRPPFAPERERWLGRGRHALVDALLATEDFWRHWYEEQLYYFLLIDNFRPESERLRELPADLASGRVDVRDALHRIALSSSFELRNPGADTFVTVVLEQLDGIAVQSERRTLEIGKALYDGQPGNFLGQTGSSQSDVVRIAVEDRRFERTFLAREFRRWLGTDLPAGELAEDARALREAPETFPALVRRWFLAPAYDERLARGSKLENRLFVNALFVDLLGRLPGDEEQRRMRGALDGLSDPLPLRAVLARLLLESGQAELPAKEAIADPTAWVADQFRRLLGREASAAELAAFVGAFHDPACRPATVLQALVSHPAYHVQ